ncbi:ABC transporter permease [Pseudonocardia sp. TRM90224]|uniref:ABC transporter permease n=1 Tax=Pseudonocardia sp. TRM90224 TaxID=2812678 RepID=UPI001E5E2DBB|nr:ABC transporter permease [Pseudonocardia sp. TRM90224]
MAAAPRLALGPAVKPAVTRGRRWRVVVFVLAGIYFLVPLLSAAEFSLRIPGSGYGFANYLAIATDPELLSSLLVSLQIAIFTAVVTLVLVVPTAVWVRLRFPSIAGLLESATILPIVVPPVVMAAGIAFVQANLGGPVFRALFASSVTALTPFYVVLALPFAYRAVDNGLAAIPLRTLVEAARNLGAGMPSTLLRVVLPAIRTAVLGAAFLTLALVLGEIVIARILLYTDTFPVAVVEVGRSAAGVSVALSLASLLLAWVLLLAVSFAGGARKRSSA